MPRARVWFNRVEPDSSVIFLFTTPIIYLYLDRLQNRPVRPRK
jgi:hypothetical protein